jgi:hypothetical protein
MVTPKCSISFSWWQDFHFPTLLLPFTFYLFHLSHNNCHGCVHKTRQLSHCCCFNTHTQWLVLAWHNCHCCFTTWRQSLPLACWWLNCHCCFTTWRQSLPLAYWWQRWWWVCFCLVSAQTPENHNNKTVVKNNKGKACDRICWNSQN